MAAVGLYLLWRRAAKAEGGEYELDALVRPGEEQVDALPRLAVRIDQARRVEGAVLRPVRDAYEPLVALCKLDCFCISLAGLVTSNCIFLVGLEI